MKICHPHLMDGIGASLEATHEVNLHCEVINNEGNVSVLEGTGIFMPDLNCRHLIPQACFMKLQRLNETKGSFAMIWYESVLNISDHVPITIHYE